MVCLCRNGKPKSFAIHRLVALAFIPNPLSLPQVNHKDEDRLNNEADNLEWCDNKYNCSYGKRGQRLSDALSGRRMPEETRRKISKTMRDKKRLNP